MAGSLGKGAYRSAISGRYVTVKDGRSPGSPITKDRVARIEASWRRASEATGAFQGKVRQARTDIRREK